MTSLRLQIGVAISRRQVLVATTANAHHSAAMFDDSRVVELKGVVKELQWTNPHVWLQVTVDDKGREEGMERRSRQPEYAVAQRVEEHVVQAWRRRDGARQSDEGRVRRRQFHRREVRERRSHDR